MGLNAAVQALKKAEPLKDKVQRCKDLLNDNDAWVCQQQLQKIYQQVLILDLEYALDRKVEQELWNLGFKNYIATLQSQAKDRKNPKRGESQALLSWCLEAASGFYLTLLQEICTAFNLDLPFRRKGYVYGCTSPWKAVEKLSVPHKSSCFYACQYCLVHLGDIARYRNESKQAELFYRHAVSLSPSSGQPYNQLALLEASRGNKLGTVFHYARSVAVKHPFPVATSNLAKTLSSALNDNSFNIDGKTKLNSQEYIAVFLKLHGVIHNLGNLKIASTYARLLTDTLTALVATESFSSWMLVQMFVINLYALDHTTDVITENSESLRREELTADEKLARECILDLIAGSLSALLLPVYTIKNSIIDYFALPSIKLCLDWIHTKPTVLEDLAFTSRLQIWPSLCVLLNALQNCVADFTYDQYVKVPLPEDRDLQGFLPLEKSFECLKFTSSLLEGDIDASNKLRAVRILRLGHRLAQYRINGTAFITITVGEGNGDNRFSSIGEDTGPSNELMKELEELSLNKEKHLKMSPSPVISESIGSKGSVDPDAMENAMDKRMGILKPQGSLERNRDSVIGNTDSSILEPNVIPAARKPRQNIAMQAIMRRAENEQKQVTFRNVSPLIVDEENKEKAKIPTTSPTKTVPVGNKGVPVSGDTIKSNTACNATTMIAVQSRPPLMPFATTPTVQTQTPLFGQSSSKLTKPMQHSIAQSPQVNHQPLKEQQISAILPPISGVSQCIGSVCYQNQPFNVQNSQFAKNFSASHAGNMPSYQIQSQLPASVQAISQNVSLQHTLNQNRPLHQRVAHNASQTALLHQSMGISSPISQGIIPNVSKSINSQQVGNPVLPQSIAMQQQSHNMSIQSQNVGKITSKSNALPSHGQINVAAPPVTNISTLAALNTYQKNLHQAASIASSVSSVPSVPNMPSMANMANMPNVQNGSSVTNISLNASSASNFPLQFSKNNFGQNTFGQITRKQLSPSIYNKTSDTLEFPFPSQGGTLKNQSQTTNAYPSFQNYDIRDFSLWKNTQQPQLSIPCWGSNSSAMQSRNQDSLPMEDYGKNWEDTSNSVNMIDRVGVGVGVGVAVGVGMGASNGYQSDSQHGRHFGGTNCFDEPRPLEVELKSSQPINTGNTYSLFSSNTWGSSLQSCDTSNQEQVKTRLNQQSLWSGPGPSPLERLLEQQKSLREGGT